MALVNLQFAGVSFKTERNTFATTYPATLVPTSRQWTVSLVIENDTQRDAVIGQWSGAPIDVTFPDTTVHRAVLTPGTITNHQYPYTLPITLTEMRSDYLS